MYGEFVANYLASFSVIEFRYVSRSVNAITFTGWLVLLGYNW